MNSLSQKAKEIFVSLVEDVPAEEWDNRVNEACRGDEELRRRVHALLLAHAQPDRRLEHVAVHFPVTIDQPITEKGGTVIGPYKLLQQIGRGGMGVVYEAEDTTLGRRVALKILPFAALLSQQQLERFNTEVTAAARLQHPGIVTIYSVGCEHGIHFYAMQLIDGPSLADVIAQMQTERHAGEQQQLVETVATGKADVLTRDEDGSHYRSVARIGKEAAEALEYAHAHGVMHRDIKPSNLLLDKTGRVWIADFGLARVEDESDLTRTGDILGTLRYMSPEQATGDRLDARTDIYSLGATLYELATLQPAFDAEDRRDIIRQVLAGKPTAPHKVDDRLSKRLSLVISKSIAPLGDRYQSAHELAEDLRRYLDGEAVLARPPSPLRRATAALRRHPIITISSIALLITFGVLIAQTSRTFFTAWPARPQVTRNRGAEEMLRKAPARGSTRGARVREQRAERSKSQGRNGFRQLLHEPLEDRRLLTTGSISGTVFEDLDADGVQDVGEAGMAGQTVVLGRTDPLLMVTDPTPQVSEKFGFVIASTETSLVVSNQFDDAAGDNTGSVFVFDIETGALTATIPNPSPDYEDHFGQGMAASNGKLVIGAPWDDTDGLQSGIAYLYDLTGNKLAEFHNPNPVADEASDWFGNYPAWVGDNVVICAGTEDFGGIEHSGAAYLFNTAGDLLATIENPSPDAYDTFGSAVASSGSEIFISAFWDDTLATDAGTVYVFDHAGQFTGRVFHNPAPGVDGLGDQFGSRIAATEDQLLVAAWQADQGATDAGAVYLFDIATGNLLQTFLNPSPDAADLFGSSISFVDGWVAIGARAEDAHATNGGIVYLFDPDTGHLIHTLGEPVPTEEAYFGMHMAAVGNTLWISATRSESATGGAAYAFQIPTRQATDALGNYNFSSLEAGTYDVRATAPAGYVQTVPGGDGTHTVSLSAGESVAGLDFGNLAYATYENNSPTQLLDARNAARPGVTKSTIDVTGEGKVFDVNVEANITHPSVGQLALTLIAPDGTTVDLVRYFGDTGDNFTETTFDDAAPTLITSGSPPFTGTFRPVEPLAAFANLDVAGTWTLEILDQTRGDTGTLTNWSLEIAAYQSEPNAPPVAVDDSASTNEDAAIVIDVLANDSDPDPGDVLAVSSVTQGANGTVSDNGDGTVTYTPDADFNGSDNFTYTISDGSGGTDTATVSVSVSSVDDPPVADAGEPYAVEVGGTVQLDASGSSDPDLPYGDSLTYAWDLNGDSVFDDASGLTTTFDATGLVEGTIVDVAVQVTDSTANSSTSATTVTVQTAAAGMHVADLDGASSDVNKRKWLASVSVLVVDGSGAPVSDATVSGSWSNAVSSMATTDADGLATVSSGNLDKSVGSITFQISSVTHATLQYDPAANMDPDEDSDGTSIVVYQGGAATSSLLATGVTQTVTSESSTMTSSSSTQDPTTDEPLFVGQETAAEEESLVEESAATVDQAFADLDTELLDDELLDALVQPLL